MTTRERVEQIRTLMTMRLPGGKGVIIKTHKNSFAYDLLEFIDEQDKREAARAAGALPEQQ